MQYDISEFEKRVAEGLLRKCEWDNLVLYGYTDKCTFERGWDQHTRLARGLILDKYTGELIAKPFPKFFNLGEMEETLLCNLPALPYKAYEKVDGSLGIIFNYKGEWRVATRGSFYSDQAVEAQAMLPLYDLGWIHPSTTLLVEIIYPANKIIVNYGEERKLVLLGAYDRVTGEEYSDEILKAIAHNSDLALAKSYGTTIEQMIEMQKTLPKDVEGFVVRFDNSLRVKIKGDEYMRIAKMISNMSPISFWESMEDGIVKRDYLAQLPEEFRQEFEPIVNSLEKQYALVRADICLAAAEHGLLQMMQTDPIWKKAVGLYLANNKVRHANAIFPLLLNYKETIDYYIMKQIRPDSNELREIG